MTEAYLRYLNSCCHIGSRTISCQILRIWRSPGPLPIIKGPGGCYSSARVRRTSAPARSSRSRLQKNQISVLTDKTESRLSAVAITNCTLNPRLPAPCRTRRYPSLHHRHWVQTLDPEATEATKALLESVAVLLYLHPSPAQARH